MSNRRKIKRKVVEAVPLPPLPQGSITLAALMGVRQGLPDADFCRCDPALGEHLSSTVEAEDGSAVLHFTPAVNGKPPHVLALIVSEA